MRDEVLLDGFDLILVPPGATHFFVRPEHYERVAAWRAESIVVQRIMATPHDPDWQVLGLLGVHEHPLNLHPHELCCMIQRGLYERGIELYQLRWTPSRPAERSSTEALPAPALSAEPRHFITIDAVDEDGEPLSSLVLSLRFADGEQRTAITGAAGQLHIDEIASGMCQVQLRASQA